MSQRTHSPPPQQDIDMLLAEIRTLAKSGQSEVRQSDVGGDPRH